MSIEEKFINTIRLLAVDEVSKANSGHPGAPLGLAPTAHVIFKNMKFNPKEPNWPNRDRFVLSNGHACALLYAMLCLYGYKTTVDDLKQFRQVGSKTPGHPEADIDGVEVTTGPLGQGISNAVGLAIAQKQFAARFNTDKYTISDNYTYCILGDGCLMEGVASEASSLAGHLQLDNLIAFWDDNQITIDGDTKCAFTEDVLERYKAYGWNVLHVAKGDDDINAIQKAIDTAKQTKGKPTLIKVTTVIGYGSLLQGTHEVHGAPLKADDVAQLKKKFGFDPERSFIIPAEVEEYAAKHVTENVKIYNEWTDLVKKYVGEEKNGPELQRRIEGKLPTDWVKALPRYSSSDKALATRKLSEMVLDNITAELPELIGGSADLTGSNLTKAKGTIDFQPPSTGLGDYDGVYIRYGVREHGMGAIMNGIHAFGVGYKAFGGTFLNFVSYASGAVRLSALSEFPVIWVATHDSIGLGEDGPTHQPVETLAHFRATPNLMVWRPADGNEVSAAYQAAIESTHTPSIIALTRQNLPQLEHSSIESALKGGYVVYPAENPDLIIVSSGSEVSLSIDAAKKMAGEGYKVRVVSMVEFLTFDKQPEDYKLSVLPDGVPIMSLEVMSTFGWSKYSHEQFGLNTFGASGKGPDVYKKFGFTVDGVTDKAAKVIEFYQGKQLVSPLKRAFN